MVDTSPEIDWAVQYRPAANVYCIRAVEDAKGRSGSGNVYSGQLPAADYLLHPSFRGFGRRDIPSEVGYKPVAYVVVRKAVVQVRVKRIEVPQVEVAVLIFAEGR